jgi:hypothetical protein
MARYELSVLGGSALSGAAQAEIVAITNPMSILEMGCRNNAATAGSLAVGRPANTPAGGTAQTATGQSDWSTTGASLGGIITTGWTTAPTAPAAGRTLRAWSVGAVIGDGMVFTWEPGEFVVPVGRANGVVVWNLAAVSAQRIYIKWTE